MQNARVVDAEETSSLFAVDVDVDVDRVLWPVPSAKPEKKG